MTEGIILRGSVTINSYEPDPELSFAEWINIGNTFREMHNSVLWWIGDWLMFGRGKWGEMYSQAISTTEYTYDFLRKLNSVSGKFEFGCRHPNLSWSHHKEVAYVDDLEKREKLLILAEDEGISAVGLREVMKRPEWECMKPGMVSSVFAVGQSMIDKIESYSQRAIGKEWTQKNHDVLMSLLLD